MEPLVGILSPVVLAVVLVLQYGEGTEAVGERETCFGMPG
jgi:hypothetical protein